MIEYIVVALLILVSNLCTYYISQKRVKATAIDNNILLLVSQWCLSMKDTNIDEFIGYHNKITECLQRTNTFIRSGDETLLKTIEAWSRGESTPSEYKSVYRRSG